MTGGNRSGTSAVGSQKIGDQFLTALAAREFAALIPCFADDARFRALLPSGLREATSSDEAARCFQEWFGAADRLELLGSRFEAIADRHHLSWRFSVHRDTRRQVIEQQAFATIRNGRFVEFDLLCSGYRPEESTSTRAQHSNESTGPTVAAVLAGGDASCATLTPLIRAKLAELASGQMLEVVTSEPTAERDIISWSRLTGNALVGKRSYGTEQHFYLRKK